MTAPQRPANVPDNAVWDENNSVWIGADGGLSTLNIYLHPSGHLIGHRPVRYLAENGFTVPPKPEPLIDVVVKLRLSDVEELAFVRATPEVRVRGDKALIKACRQAKADHDATGGGT